MRASTLYCEEHSPCALHGRSCYSVQLDFPQAGKMSSTPHDPFYSSPFGPFYRRHTPYMVQPEYRIYEMNKRLQSRTEVSTSTPACVCVYFRRAVHGPCPGMPAEFRGKCPARYYHLRGNERQDGATSLNAGFPGAATLRAGNSFCWNLETDSPALAWLVGSPDGLLSQNSRVAGSQAVSELAS